MLREATPSMSGKRDGCDAPKKQFETAAGGVVANNMLDARNFSRTPNTNQRQQKTHNPIAAMKTRKQILLTSLALCLAPVIANAGDLSGTNSVSGWLSSASGYQNTVIGGASTALGYTNWTTGDICFSAGYNNLNRGGYNSILGAYNSSGTSSVYCTLLGLGNAATGRSSILAGNFLSDAGFSGSVMFTDSNPFSLRTSGAPFTSAAPDTFSATFDRGYLLRTNSRQGTSPDAGLFILPSTANSATTSFQAYVGINTDTPGVPLDVVGNGFVSNSTPSSYFGESGGLVTGYTGDYAAVSIRASNQVVANLFGAISDARIKDIQGHSDGAADLRTLRGIEITDYVFKDAIGKGNRPQKKVVAQQVEKIYPPAVSQTTDVVPDIFQKADVKDGWVESAAGVKVGDRVRLITANGNQATHEVLEVKNGAFRTGLQTKDKQVFVYGREVKDFRVVDYEAIAMLNVSATQELARKVEAKDAEIARLTAKLAAIEARDGAREARLARLEAAGKARAPRAVPASLDLQAAAK